MQTNAEKREQLIARKDREALVRAEVNAGTLKEPPPLLRGLTHISEIQPGGFPACARCRGITKAFHKPSLTGKRNSAGFVYDGHPFEPAK